jgi:hypothetical protein
MTIQQKLLEAEKIIQETKHLRDLQKEYFKYRDDATLSKLRSQGDKVDRMIIQYFPIKRERGEK